MTISRRTLWIGAGAVLALFAAGFLAWWFLWLKAPAAEAPAPEVTEEVQEPVVVYGPEVPAQWAWDDMPWRLTDFVVPRGHWVYFSRWNREFLVIPGTALPEGAPAPDEDALYAQAVVIFNDAYFDQESFSSWERFSLTMAEFGCARGTSEEDYVLCDATPVRQSSGNTPVGPYTSFSLSKRAYATQASLGFAPFTMVRLGQEGLFGILFYAQDASRGTPLMQQMVATLTRTAEVDE